MTEEFFPTCPFQVGDVLRLKPGKRLPNWRPDSNRDSAPRIARVVKVDSFRKSWSSIYGEREQVKVQGIHIKPENRKRNVWVHPVEFAYFDVIDLVKVFADFLEESGCPEEWTKLLREKFPIG